MLSSWVALDESDSYPGNIGMVAAATAPQLRLSTIPTIHEEFDKLGVVYEYSEWKGIVTFPNGSWYKYQSLDIPPAELKGSTIGWLVVDEVDACPETGVQYLIGRVRRPNTSNRVLLIGNSPPPGHWLKREFVDNPDPRWALLNSSTYENHFLPKSYFAKQEKLYPPGSAMHARMMLGKMDVPVEGAIFPEYDLSRHVISQAAFASVRPIGFVCGLDLGHRAPTCFLKAALDKDDVLYFCDEHYAPGLLLSQHASAIRQIYDGGPIFSDHDAQDRMELEALGVRTVAANKDVLMGIDAMRTRMRDGRFKIVAGKCPNLMRELPRYEWGKDERPLKVDDHAVDAARYAISGLDVATKGDLALRRAVYGTLRQW